MARFVLTQKPLRLSILRRNEAFIQVTFLEVHDFDVSQILVRDLSCVAGVRQREVAFVVRVYGRQEGARSSFLTASLTGLSSLLRDPTHSTEPALTPPQRWPLIPLQRWPRLSQPSRPPLVRTYPLSEMLLRWGPSFFKVPDEFYWEQSPCKPHLQSPSKLHLTHSGE